MPCRTPTGTRSPPARRLRRRTRAGCSTCCGCASGALPSLAASIAHDPTFALGHAALALLGHELCAEVDIAGPAHGRRRCTPAAAPSASAATCTRSTRHVAGRLRVHWSRTSRRTRWTRCCCRPRCRRSRSPVSPRCPRRRGRSSSGRCRRTATTGGSPGCWPSCARSRAASTRRWSSRCRSLAVEPGAGHSAHARAHAHYETGDHWPGWPGWTAGSPATGASIDSLSHFAWHAALHELSLGDLDAVRRRYDAQLRPEHGLGCRALVDTGSLLFRWALTPDAEAVPGLETGRGAGRA